jgi:hypothetical protein
VFGASSRENIRQTKDLIDACWRIPDAVPLQRAVAE